MNQQLVALDSMKRAVMGDGMRHEIEMALPRHVPVDRFRRVLLTSVTHDQRLMQIDPMKVVKAALKVAPLGLLTDPMLGEAYLIADGRGDCQVRIGYRGLMKLARQSGDVAAIYAHEVYRNDEFMVVLGDKKSLHHKPQMFGDRGEIVGYYAVVKYLNGETDFEIMTTPEIDRIRAKSDGWKAFKGGKIKDTPWNTAYDEMAKKTVLRRLMKRVPASSDLADALRHEAEQDDREYGGMRNVTPDVSAAQPIQAPELVELYDADGVEFLREPGTVDAWIKDQIEGATDEELAAFKEANPEREDVAAAVTFEQGKRAGPPPDDTAKAQNAPSPSAPSAQPADEAAQPTGTTATGQPEDPIHDELAEMLPPERPPTLKQRCEQINAALADHNGDPENLKSTWDLHEAEIARMPEKAKQLLGEKFDGYLEELGAK